MHITTGALKNAGAGAKFFWGCKKAYVEAFFFFCRFKSLELGRQLRNLQKKKKNTCRAVEGGGGEGGNILWWVSQDDFGVEKKNW